MSEISCNFASPKARGSSTRAAQKENGRFPVRSVPLPLTTFPCDLCAEVVGLPRSRGYSFGCVIFMPVYGSQGSENSRLSLSMANRPLSFE